MILLDLVKIHTQNPETTDSFLFKLLPSFVGTGTALLVFVLNSYRDKHKEDKRKAVEREDKMKYLIVLVDSIIRLATQQADNINQHILLIERDNFNLPLMTYNPLTDFVRATTSMGKEDYFLAFNKYYKGYSDLVKLYNNILSNIDYLHVSLMEIPNISERSLKFDEEKRFEIQKMVDDSIRTTGTFLSGADGQEQIFNDMETILNTFLQQPINNSDLEHFINNFVQPMHQFTLQYINQYNYTSHSEVKRLAGLCRDILQKYNFIGRANHSLAIQFKIDYLLICKSIDDLANDRQKLTIN